MPSALPTTELQWLNAYRLPIGRAARGTRPVARWPDRPARGWPGRLASGSRPTSAVAAGSGGRPARPACRPRPPAGSGRGSARQSRPARTTVAARGRPDRQSACGGRASAAPAPGQSPAPVPARDRGRSAPPRAAARPPGRRGRRGCAAAARRCCSRPRCSSSPWFHISAPATILGSYPRAGPAGPSEGRWSMDVVVEQGSLTEIETPLLVVNLFQDAAELGGATAAVNEAMGGLLARLREDEELRGKAGEVTLVHNPGGMALRARRVLVVGLGRRDEFGAEGARRAAATAARKAQELRVPRYATVLHGAGAGGLAPAEAAEALAEGSLLALYRYDQFKSDAEENRVVVERATVVERDPGRIDAVRAGLARGAALAAATATARDLAQGPANLVSPAYLADQARRVAEEHGFERRVHGLREIREMAL